MILKLKRAVANIIEQEIAGVRCYSDEMANEYKKYPCVYIAEIQRDQAPLGCGRQNYVRRDPSNTVTGGGKIVEHSTYLRLLVEADGSEDESATEQAHRIEKRIGEVFIGLVEGDKKTSLVDPVTGVDLEMVGIRFDSSMDLGVVTHSEPFKYRRSVTFKFTHREYLEKEVEHTIDNVRVSYAGSDVAGDARDHKRGDAGGDKNDK